MKAKIKIIAQKIVVLVGAFWIAAILFDHYNEKKFEQITGVLVLFGALYWVIESSKNEDRS